MSPVEVSASVLESLRVAVSESPLVLALDSGLESELPRVLVLESPLVLE
jgi:hypothetical protein